MHCMCSMCTYCMFVVCMWGMMAVSFDSFYVFFDVCAVYVYAVGCMCAVGCAV